MANPYIGYYRNQVQTGNSYFSGQRFQRGHGIGSFLASLFRSSILPALKSGGKYLGKQAIKTGIDVGSDLLASDFKGAKDIVKARTKESGGKIVEDIKRKLQSGSGRVRKRTTKKRAQVGSGKRRRVQRGKGVPKSYKKRKTTSKRPSTQTLLRSLNQQLR